MSRQTAFAGGCDRLGEVAIVACPASCAVVLEAAACGPCRSYGKRTERVSHSSLDGAQNAPPTTAHRHSSLSFWRRKNKNHYNDANQPGRLIRSIDVQGRFAPITMAGIGDHDAVERVITMAWTE
jgi:hypothetical protein